jgi:hypothetical protein
LFFNYLGNLIQAKTYGYNDFTFIQSRHLVFDSYGDNFYETLLYQTAAISSKRFLFRKVQLYQLRQLWTMTMGTSTGDLETSRGARVSTDDSYFFVPYDPNANNDYRPDITKKYVGLMSITTDTGTMYWHNVYTPATQFDIKPVDGEVSPDN